MRIAPKTNYDLFNTIFRRSPQFGYIKVIFLSIPLFLLLSCKRTACQCIEDGNALLKKVLEDPKGMETYKEDMESFNKDCEKYKPADFKKCPNYTGSGE